VQTEPKLDGETAGTVARPSPRFLWRLPETADRVEAHVSHRKQTTGHLSTRDGSRRHPASPPQPISGAVSPLTGTRVRLEMHVTHGKQTTGCTSNRYSSRLTCFQIFNERGVPSRFDRWIQQATILQSASIPALETSILRGPIGAFPATIRRKGRAR